MGNQLCRKFFFSDEVGGNRRREELLRRNSRSKLKKSVKHIDSLNRHLMSALSHVLYWVAEEMNLMCFLPLRNSLFSDGF